MVEPFKVGIDHADRSIRLRLFAEPIAGADEVNVVNITNPTAPRKVASFAIGRDLTVDPAGCNVGCFPASFAHSVRFTDAGGSLFVSYWDFGLIRFDAAARSAAVGAWAAFWPSRA